MVEAWPHEVLDFWFGLEPDRWWSADPEFDAEVRKRFRDLWDRQRQCPAETFLTDPDTALAAIILFDQFPRNMFRGHADSYATDHLALALAKDAIARGFDEGFEQPHRGFFYMPFQHSENLDDQQRSVALFAALGDEEQLRFAKLHHDVIDRFGRFPHRNAVLGRTPRADEVEAGQVVPW